MADRDYIQDSPTLCAFHRSNAKFRLAMGPVGSGKTTACLHEIMMRALAQRPGTGVLSGIRASRWAVVRNTYAELKNTTIASWNEEFGESFGRPGKTAPFELNIKRRLPDGTLLDTELRFISIDDEADIKKLLSWNITGAYVNECRELPWAVFEPLLDRCGRYPRQDDGGSSWNGVIADTNPPDEMHWIYRIFEQEKPANPVKWAGFEMFRQPGAVVRGQDGVWRVNPRADNLNRLRPDYYDTTGKDEDHILVYYAAQYAYLKAGKPIFGNAFNQEFHVAKEPLALEPGATVYVGIDGGNTPCATITQQMPPHHRAAGQWRGIAELVTPEGEISNMMEFAREKLGPAVGQMRAANFTVELYLDPGANARAQTDGRDNQRILEAAGLGAALAPGNNRLDLRIAVVSKALATNVRQAQPGLLLSPTCKTLIRAMATMYRYKKLPGQLGEQYDEAPQKNHPYSDVAEALQYAMLGGGAHHMLRDWNEIPGATGALDGRPLGGVA